jgi:HK97 family phage portal protein
MTLRSRFSAVAAAFRGNPLDNPATPLNAAAAWMFDLFTGGTTAAGVSVNEHTAMRLDTVYSCVNVLGSDISSLQLKVFEQDGKGGKAPAISSKLYYLLTVEPNPEMTAPTFFATWTGSAILTGNGYAEIQWDESNSPIALWPRHPDRVRPRRATAGERLTNNLAAAAGDLVYEVTDTGQTRIVAAEDMLHLTGLSRDGWIGISPIKAAAQTIGTAIQAEKFIGGFFGRGSRPSGILTGPVDDRDPAKRQQARESWEKANGGDSQGRTAVLPNGWSWTAIGISPQEAQFLETLGFTRTQICGIFRVPPHMIGDTSRLSNGNHESIALEYATFTLRPWMVRIEAEIQRKLMPSFGRKANKLSVAYDIYPIIRGDFASQMNGFATGKQWTFYTTNEIRAKLGENPVEGGDVFYVPLNMVPIGKDGLPVQADVQDASGGGEGGQEPTPQGNGGQNQRMLLERIGQAYGGLFRNAHGRLMKRSKRDADAVAHIFGPVLEAIAFEAQRQARAIFRVDKDADLGA